MLWRRVRLEGVLQVESGPTSELALVSGLKLPTLFVEGADSQWDREH